MRCTCCLFMLTLWSAAAGWNNRMPMCIGSFSLHSKWIGLSKRYPNSSVLRRDVESDRLIGNQFVGKKLISLLPKALDLNYMYLLRMGLKKSTNSKGYHTWPHTHAHAHTHTHTHKTEIKMTKACNKIAIFIGRCFVLLFLRPWSDLVLNYN